METSSQQQQQQQQQRRTMRTASAVYERARMSMMSIATKLDDALLLYARAGAAVAELEAERASLLELRKHIAADRAAVDDALVRIGEQRTAAQLHGRALYSEFTASKSRVDEQRTLRGLAPLPALQQQHGDTLAAYLERRRMAAASAAATAAAASLSSTKP
jgi:hypothetical protein